MYVLCLLCYALILGMLYLPHISAVGITESAEVAEERKKKWRKQEQFVGVNPVGKHFTAKKPAITEKMLIPGRRGHLKHLMSVLLVIAKGCEKRSQKNLLRLR